MSKAGWRYRRMPGGKCHWEKDINGRVYRLHLDSWGIAYDVTMDGKHILCTSSFKHAISIAQKHAKENK